MAVSLTARVVAWSTVWIEEVVDVETTVDTISNQVCRRASLEQQGEEVAPNMCKRI